MSGPITILVVDDDLDDRLLISDAFEESQLGNPLHLVNDGEELIAYLHRRAEYECLSAEPYPGVILLDLNMPRKDGATALSEIRQDPKLRHVPVVVFTTAGSADTVERAYALGANSFITKPSSFEELCDIVKVVSRYWCDIVTLPSLCRV